MHDFLRAVALKTRKHAADIQIQIAAADGVWGEQGDEVWATTHKLTHSELYEVFKLQRSGHVDMYLHNADVCDDNTVAAKTSGTASQPALFPWTNLGHFKMLLVLVAAASPWRSVHVAAALAPTRLVLGIVANAAERLANTYQCRTLHLRCISEKQTARESAWDDCFVLHVFAFWAVACVVPEIRDMPNFIGWQGVAFAFVIHFCIVEPVYYVLHRALHRKFLWKKWHWVHHQSSLPQAISGSVHPLGEHLVYTALFATPTLAAIVFRRATGIAVADNAAFAAYLLFFDLANMFGHCNVELVPRWWHARAPYKYMFYSAGFHDVHHRGSGNFCLFVPLWDYLGGTASAATPIAPAVASSEVVARTVFLAHGMDFFHPLRASWASVAFPQLPHSPALAQWLLSPVVFAAWLLLWGRSLVFGPTCAFATRITARSKPPAREAVVMSDTFVVPLPAAAYFIPATQRWALAHVDRFVATHVAQKSRVVGLGNLNKAAFMNKGGERYRALCDPATTSIVHGNTLTAACVIKRLVSDKARAIFITGAASCVANAIAAYMVARGCEVFRASSAHCDGDVPAGHTPPRRCTHWVLCSPRSTMGRGAIVNRAQRGTVVLPVVAASESDRFIGSHQKRADLVYGTQPSATIAPEPKCLGMPSVSYCLPAGRVYACHAGAVLHALAGWEHHELGAVDVGAIETVLAAATQFGFILHC